MLKIKRITFISLLLLLLLVLPMHTVTTAKKVKEKVKSVTLTFNSNGGKVSGKKIIKIKNTYKKAIILAKNPTRKDYIFKGWYTKKNDGNKITTKTKVPKRNTTYYAHWSQNDMGLSGKYYMQSDTINSYYNFTSPSDVTFYSMPGMPGVVFKYKIIGKRLIILAGGQTGLEFVLNKERSEFSVQDGIVKYVKK